MLVAVPPSNLTQSMASSPLMPHAHHTHATKTMEPSRSICSIWNPYPTPISMLMDMFLRVPTLLSSNVVMSMWKTAAKMDKQEEKKVSEHCREEGCIVKYIPRGPRDFPRLGVLHPEARETARGSRDAKLRPSPGINLGPGAAKSLSESSRERSQSVRGYISQYIPTRGSVQPFSQH